jgi:hypothetical protein
LHILICTRHARARGVSDTSCWHQPSPPSTNITILNHVCTYLHTALLAFSRTHSLFSSIFPCFIPNLFYYFSNLPTFLCSFLITNFLCSVSVIYLMSCFIIPYFHNLFVSNFFFSYRPHSSIPILSLVYWTLLISCFLTSSFLALLRTCLLNLFRFRIHKLNNQNFFSNLQLILYVWMLDIQYNSLHIDLSFSKSSPVQSTYSHPERSNTTYEVTAFRFHKDLSSRIAFYLNPSHFTDFTHLDWS